MLASGRAVPPGERRGWRTAVRTVYYAKSCTNQRTFTLTNGDLIEYSCEENNRALWEGRIKMWTPPAATPIRPKP